MFLKISILYGIQGLFRQPFKYGAVLFIFLNKNRLFSIYVYCVWNNTP